uniref:Clathrin light chain n=1 Tax=Lotharella globosa TaxID=91324 RepID=A0A7S3ZBJ1_9EUKA
MEDQLSPMRAEMQGGENVFYDQGSEDPPVEGEEDPFGAAVDEGAGEGGAGAQDDPDAVFDVDGAGAGEVAAAEDDPFGGALDAKDAGDITTMAPPADGPYAKWEEEHKKLLEERLQAAREKKEKNLEEAESALIKFDEKRGADKEKMHEDNLADEKEKRAQIEKLFKSGENDWEKVCKMLSLKADSNRKVDRFRKLLATLKVV